MSFRAPRPGLLAAPFRSPEWMGLSLGVLSALKHSRVIRPKSLELEPVAEQVVLGWVLLVGHLGRWCCRCSPRNSWASDAHVEEDAKGEGDAGHGSRPLLAWSLCRPQSFSLHCHLLGTEQVGVMQPPQTLAMPNPCPAPGPPDRAGATKGSSSCKWKSQILACFADLPSKVPQ